MDSISYNKIIIEAKEKGIISSPYSKTVGRQLTVFKTPAKIKEYIESKSNRIFLDHEYFYGIKWNRSKKGKVSLTKDNFISFPSIYIEEKKQVNILSAIPYGLALYFHSQSSKQDLVDISFIQWLNFFTKKFFGFYLNEEDRLDILVDSLFADDIIKNSYFQNVNKANVKAFSDGEVKSYYFVYDIYHVFYLNFHERHLLFRFKEKKSINI